MDWNPFIWAMMMSWLRKQQQGQKQESNIPPLEIHQQEAIKSIFSNWEKQTNSLCALDVGMGKTRVACEILSNIFEIGATKRLQGYALVCCPTMGTIESIWSETLNSFKTSKLILEGDVLKRKKLVSKKKLTIPPLTVCLITYANLIRSENIEYFINTPPNLIIFDEYHTLTNNSQKQDQGYRNAIKKLPVNLRIGLTATPFVNNEMESVLAYGFLNDNNLIDDFFSSNKDCKKSLLQTVKEKDFLFYKNNPYKSTPVSEWIISIPMGKEFYGQYLKIKEESSNNNISTTHRIGRFSISPDLVTKTKNLRSNQSVETGKIKALRTIISRLPSDDKIVICDNQKATLEYISKLDFIRPLKPVCYFGGAKSSNKKNYNSFINNPECRLFLTTRQEGGEGLNLQVANHIILLNCWYTAKDIIQIIGRIKRKGQRKPVYAYILSYNLSDCLEPGMELSSIISKEDESYFRMVRKKVEMCEEWGIEIKTKLPHLKSFFNYDSFQEDFNLFLEQTAFKEPLKITHNNMSKEITHKREEYYGDEQVNEETYLSNLVTQYGDYRRSIDIKNQGEIKNELEYNKQEIKETIQASTQILSHDNEKAVLDEGYLEETEVYEVEEIDEETEKYMNGEEYIDNSWQCEDNKKKQNIQNQEKRKVRVVKKRKPSP